MGHVSGEAAPRDEGFARLVRGSLGLRHHLRYGAALTHAAVPDDHSNRQTRGQKILHSTCSSIPVHLHHPSPMLGQFDIQRATEHPTGMIRSGSSEAHEDLSSSGFLIVLVIIPHSESSILKYLTPPQYTHDIAYSLGYLQPTRMQNAKITSYSIHSVRVITTQRKRKKGMGKYPSSTASNPAEDWAPRPFGVRTLTAAGMVAGINCGPWRM